MNQAEIAIEANKQFNELIEGRTRYYQSGIEITAHVMIYKCARVREDYFQVKSSEGMVFSEHASLEKHLKRG